MSDFEQCSNRLELDLISLLVNFACELEQIMTRYDFLWLDELFWAMFKLTWTWPNGRDEWFWLNTPIMRRIMTRYDFLLHRQVILSNVRTDSQLNLILLINFSCELGQIMTRYDLLGTRRVILSNFQTDSNLT